MPSIGARALSHEIKICKKIFLRRINSSKANKGVEFRILRKKQKKSLKTNDKKSESFDLFECFECGVHPKAIEVLTLDGDQDKKVILCKNIRRDKTEIKHKLGVESYDGAITIEVICGICGKSGRMTKISKETLDFNEAINSVPEFKKINGDV